MNRAREAAWCGSGKVLNAGMAVHRLGGPSLTLAPLGGPPLAEIEREFAALGVPRRWIETRAATRVCTTILDRATGRITELVENGRPLGRRASWTPSAPPMPKRPPGPRSWCSSARCPAARRWRSIASWSPCTPCPMVLDFRGDGLLSVLDLKPYVVKPNREELGQTFGRSLDDDADLLAAMRELNRLGAQWVVVTQGAEAVWVSFIGAGLSSYAAAALPRSSIPSAAATAWPPASPGRRAAAIRSSMPSVFGMLRGGR